MPRFSPRLLATAAACLTTGIAAAQGVSSTPSATASTAPVAYVYVSSQPGGTGHIYGYAASASGQLTPVAGSPFSSTASALALNGKWLFGSHLQSNLIYSYAIAANGSIKQADSYDSSPYTAPNDLFLDHTGASLYVGFSDGVGDNGYEALNINQTTGKLSLVNASYTGVGEFFQMTFIGDNKFAYGNTCYHFDPTIYGFARVSGGGLSSLGTDAPLPTAPSGDQYCPLGGTATDPYNDVVVPLQQIPSDGGNPTAFKLAVYTSDPYGKLSTTSTAANMATVQVEPDTLAMSPKGFYLAAANSDPSGVGPNGGIQVFLMHGSKPLTVLTGVVIPGVYVNQMYWDNNEHLYAVSNGSGKLYVFNVSTSGTTQVAGSPYSIPSPSGLIVLPK